MLQNRDPDHETVFCSPQILRYDPKIGGLKPADELERRGEEDESKTQRIRHNMR